jgi:threonine dehydratase
MSMDQAVIRQRIAPYTRITPVIDIGNAGYGPVVLKLDTLQPTGSFKVRGAANAILSLNPRPTRVVAASGGNHGAAVAFVCQRLGIRADLFVPESTPPAKLDLMSVYGAHIHKHGQVISDAFVAAKTFVAEHGAPFTHAFDDENVVAGQASCMAEFIEQADFDTLLVGVGGGGLAAGCVLARKPGQKIVCVETTGTKTLHIALATGHPVRLDVTGVSKDSLGPPQVGAYPFSILKDADVASLVVSDDDVRAAQRFLWTYTRVIGEPGGVTALAALTSGAYKIAPGERVGIIVSGANCDPKTVVS